MIEALDRMLDGVEPEWERAAMSQDDAEALGAQTWLESHEIDDSWYDVATGRPVF
jgi:hypothetical protein